MNDARCIDRCIPDGEKMSVLVSVLYQLLQNGTGGGGSGSVTSFSSGNLSPLFTTSVATATTTPALSFALSTQNANTIFAGPTSGGAVAPTFRAMVNADLGTTLTPQFLRLGVGAAADAVTPLSVTRPTAGFGAGVEVIRCDCPGSDPYMVFGTSAANDGGGFKYYRSTNNFRIFIFGGSGAVNIDAAANATFDGSLSIGLNSAGVFSCQNTAGVSGTFNASNTVTVKGGIVTNIA